MVYVSTGDGREKMRTLPPQGGRSRCTEGRAQLTESALSEVERGEALDVPAQGTLWRSPDGGLQMKVREPLGAVMRAWMLRQCHRLVPEKVRW
jgi:hypothetical protein